MIIIPAIDIIDGKPVRLYQGDYNKKEIVAKDVLDTSKKFEYLGAQWIHLVDLDGAKKGELVNLNVIILGTSAMEDEKLLNKALREYGEKIAVGIDCKDGYVCGRGWLQKSSIHYIEFAKRLEKLGVKNIIVTDISKDGTLEGPNIEMLNELKKEVCMDITASGGIRDVSNIKALKEIDVYGAITGKAIYAKTLSLEEAIKVTREE